MSENKSIGKPFEPGHAKVGGRVKGARNKLSADFLSALVEDFREHGAKVIPIVRVEKPDVYLKLIGSTVTKEFEINDNRLKDVDDATLFDAIEFALRHRARSIGSADSGEDQALN